MKRYLKILLPVVLVTAFYSLAFAQTKWGDVNGNGAVDIVDALTVAQYYVGLISSLPAEQAADVDGNGQINIVDALLIAQYYVGIITVFPAETTPTITQTAAITLSQTPAKTPTQSQHIVPSLACLSCPVTVKGMVMSAGGQPIPEANIMGSGSTPLTLTDSQGAYSVVTEPYTNSEGNLCQRAYNIFKAEKSGSTLISPPVLVTFEDCQDHTFDFTLTTPKPVVTLAPGATPSPSPTRVPTCTCAPCPAMFITGKVTNAAGQPVAGAKIYQSYSLRVITDELGNYSLSPVKINVGCCKQADLPLTIKATGYQDLSPGPIPYSCSIITRNWVLTSN